MITISLCMIVKNEADVLHRCLSSVEAAVDEIIIVDTGSEDETITIAETHQAKVYSFPWCDDFAAVRNYSFDQASMDYILWLDADDVVPAAELAKLNQLKQTMDEAYDMVMMQYHTAFDVQGRPTFSFARERLIRRKANLRWEGAVHETIPLAAHCLNTDIAVEHHKLKPKDTMRNLRILEKISRHGGLSARQQFYYARELADHKRYAEAVDQYTAFLNAPDGWAENQIEACLGLAACYESLHHETKGALALLQAFLYAPPRAEVCCALGNYFYRQQAWNQAVFWFDLATKCKVPLKSGGFIRLDCYGYIPWISLCCCYDKLKDWRQAWLANEAAGSFKPDDAAYLYNRQYLSQSYDLSKTE